MTERARATAEDRVWHRALMFAVRRLAWLRGGVYTVGSLAVVVRSDGQVLCVKPRYRAGWGLPGGFVKRHEQPVDTLTRELLEEVGMSVGAWDVSYIEAHAQQGRRHIDHLYVVEVAQAEVAHVTARAELSSAAWFELDELPPLQHEAAWALARWQRLRDDVAEQDV